MPTLDQVLDAIEKVESGGNPYARSPAGAMGAYQFMPATAKEYGLTNPYDKRASRAAAERKMQDLLHEYDNDLPRAVAAYNLGQGNMRKVGGDWTRVPETNQYVKKVAAASMAKQQPAQDDEWEDVTHEYLGKAAAPADDEWEDVTHEYVGKEATPAPAQPSIYALHPKSYRDEHAEQLRAIQVDQEGKHAETGRTVKYKQAAIDAFDDLDTRITFANRLMECLKS